MSSQPRIKYREITIEKGITTKNPAYAVLKASNLLFYLAMRMHWRAGLRRGKGGWPLYRELS
jgi:hypothetical protein